MLGGRRPRLRQRRAPRARSGSSRRPAPARRRPRACSTRAGAGVSQIVGVGGRDLSAEVGGIMFRQGMRLLAADDATETLLLVSKPPAREVVAALGDVDVPDGKRVVAAFVGWERRDGAVRGPPHAGGRRARGRGRRGARRGDLRRGRRRPRARAGRRCSACSPAARWPTRRPSCSTPSSVTLPTTPGAVDGDGHAVFDLGTEEYTQGRPHPMVDLERAAASCSRRRRATATGCVLLDVVSATARTPTRRASWRARSGGGARRARWWRACAVRPRTRRTPSARPRSCAPPGRSSRRPTRPPRGSRRGRCRVRVAMLTYSVRPRGGVVHALEVAEALAARGHDVRLFAIAPPGQGFFRAPPVPGPSAKSAW